MKVFIHELATNPLWGGSKKHYKIPFCAFLWIFGASGKA